MKTLKKHRGFTLIEIIMVMITVGIVAVPVVGMFGSVGKSLILNSETTEADGYVQACAEHIVVRKQNIRIALIDNTICSSIPTSATFTLNVIITNGAAHASCPTAIGTPTCVAAEITATVNGNVRSSAVVFLVE
ncbi:MAG: prepilin-type N-terminal cleavage/methylation domain-containing protein [Gammaproteobacteria bacterium]|nr:prepilin-type N-terminal cleavage/methylation domain-containing protein [Gammaproteobacteria bacterium]